MEWQELEGYGDVKAFHTWLRHPELAIHVIGDVHIGNPYSREDKLYDLLASLKENEFVIFVGDLVDNAIIDSIQRPYEATLQPHEQFASLWRLLADYKHKILGIVEGNHEARTRRRVGVDVIELFASEHGIPYSRSVLVLDIAVGTKGKGSKKRADYLFVIGHGRSGAGTVGGKVNAADRITRVLANADVYVTGHTHQPVVLKKARLQYDYHNKKVQLVPYYVIAVPGWLEYPDYEAVSFQYPKPLGEVTIHLYEKPKRVIPLLT